MNSEAQKQIASKAVVYTVGGLFAYFGAIRPILVKLGVIKSKQGKIIEAARKWRAFDRKFWKNNAHVMPKGANYILFAYKDAASSAEKLHEAMDGAGTDESAIFYVFKRLKSIPMASQLSDYYANTYKADLFTDLVSDLSEDDMMSVLNIVKALPLYNFIKK